MNGLGFLVDWFERHCDDDWEHESNIRIATLDNPGWALDVRIAETELEGRVVDWVKSDEDDLRWLYWRSTGLTFEARCGPRDLERAIAAFVEFASSAAPDAARAEPPTESP